MSDIAPPLVIAHRGASGYLPEHTIEAYRLAIEMGADVIEPDVVVTKDGVLITRHESNLSETTDVSEHPEFADRHTTKFLDGANVSGWFAEDFTLAEIKTLWARERIPEERPESAAHNDEFRIATLAEIIALVNEVETDTGRQIAIAPETKNPTYFGYYGTYLDGTPLHIDISAMLVEALVSLGFTDAQRVFIQSFDLLNLMQLEHEIMPAAGVDFQLVQLLGGAVDVAFHLNPAYAALGADPTVYAPYAFGYPLTAAAALNGELFTPAAIQAMAQSYADFIAPPKDALLTATGLARPVDADGDGTADATSILTGATLDLAALAEALGIGVIPWTVRIEEGFRALNPDGTEQLPVEEYVRLYDLGLSALFTDFPDLGREIADQWAVGEAAIAASNDLGGKDILVRALDGLTAAKGTAAHDRAIYWGEGTVVLPGTIEELRLHGAADVSVVGNALDNRLLGNAGDNRFFETAGRDRIDGGIGRDMLVLEGSAGDYTVTVEDGIAVIGNTATGGIQRTANVETLLFADGAQALFATGQTEIASLYRTLLGRAAETGGFDFWAERSHDGMSLQEMAQGFAAADEFAARSAGLTTANFVATLYAEALNRQGEAAGLQWWAAQIDGGAMSRDEAAVGFLSSAEFAGHAAEVWLFA
ncbi:glycerophosphoryl diester phosphodiesterase [Humitalea rosea]|uniref:glycerophosphodiester phosphodiesterase n=1 Tax=Humitalea rosea TaxID=990373 RepID=A0A2W7IG62_9PROT|nr:glycerophosphodiester phosphodiesterase family protein [Humitalea rosea]PZW45733.1 glycerophosphoryl diester phosphodiesterase [Humitalea rosea]